MAVVNVGGKINLALSVPNLDNKYGPYTSVQEAWDILGPDNLDVLAIGLTVGIQPTPTSPITEYWFRSGCSSVNDLVPKASGGQGTSDYIDLVNKPSINNVELIGQKSLEDLGINMDSKQDALVSGTNIKTINNQSILGEGNLDIGGDIEGDKNYVFKQNVASDVWVIRHDLNKYPSVTVIDSSGGEVYGQVTYDNLNQVTITFKAGFKGSATLN